MKLRRLAFAVVLPAVWLSGGAAQTLPEPNRLLLPPGETQSARTPPIIIQVSSISAQGQSATAAPAPDAAAAQAQAAEAMKKLGEAVEKIGKNLTVVTGKEEWKIALFGELKGEVLWSKERPLTSSAPFFLLPGSPFGLSQDTIDVHGKSTMLGALIMGPEICGYKAGGMILGALYSETLVTDIYGFLPLLAYGELKNDFCRFSAGLQFDVFNPLNPNMINFNNLFASGNAGLYRGEFRVEKYFYPTPTSQITVQAAIGDPLPTTVTDAFRISETNGVPNVEGRIALALGCVEGEGPEARRPFEVGVSGLAGQVRTTEGLTGRREVADAWGLGADARWKFSERCGVQAEVFYGQTLGTYGGGVLQTVNTLTFEGIHSRGGWGEFYFYLTPCVHLHVGYGIDNPRDEDVFLGQILRNDTYFSTLYWDVTKDFRLGVEVSQRETDYRALPNNDGILVQSQVRWKF